MRSLIDYFKKDPQGDFDQGQALNEANGQRNWIILTILVTLAGGIYFATDYYMGSDAEPLGEPAAIDFGAVIDNDFTEKDNQSALTAQQNALDAQQRTLDKLVKTIENIERNNHTATLDLKRKLERFQQGVTDKIDHQLDTATASLLNEAGSSAASRSGVNHDADPLGLGSPQGFPRNGNNQHSNVSGQYTLPPRPVAGRYDSSNAAYQGSSVTPPATQNGIDSFTLSWQSPQQNQPQKRTPDNYVPAGTFVTAVITGGADANAGVNGQGDTVPMVFQTLNAGILPNGKPSRLNNCTIIGAVYGEISSSRGIVRTQRLSCIFDEEIIDIPVEGTVFNFGRNGIRGTTIMKNGKIVQMAGVSGILTGIGETGKALSETTSTSPLGSTTTLSGGDALLNLAGSASASVGSKLADYYIKLAEQYHPIIELNPGNTVNIVFLKGFPLDPVGISEYEEALANQTQTPLSSTAQILNTISNPLFERMPDDIAPRAANTPSSSATQLLTPAQRYHQQGQRIPVNSPFGRTQ